MIKFRKKIFVAPLVAAAPALISSLGSAALGGGFSLGSQAIASKQQKEADIEASKNNLRAEQARAAADVKIAKLQAQQNQNNQ